MRIVRGRYIKKPPAITYFLDAQGTNIIGAEGLTDVFGMGTRVSLPLWSPGKIDVSEMNRRAPNEKMANTG